MNHSLLACAVLLASLSAPCANAQNVPLPKELSGRWSAPALNASQLFSLEDIKADAAGGFSARLTWWTRDPRCAIKGEPLAGRVNPQGIAFEGRTACDITFAVELNRASSGWEGKGVITSGPGPEMFLTAK